MADQNRPESPATAQAVIACLPETVEKLRQARALLGDAFGDLVRAEPRRPDGLAVLPVPAGHQEAGSAVHDLRQKVDQLLFPTAGRDWYTEARVRIIADHDAANVVGETHLALQAAVVDIGRLLLLDVVDEASKRFRSLPACPGGGQASSRSNRRATRAP